MPGVRSVRILEEDERNVIALLRQRWMGRELEQKWKFELGDGFVRQEQLEGFFRKWVNHWRFLEPPGGDGTTVMVEIDFDLGFLGRISPQRWIQDSLDRMFDEVIDKAEARVRSILTGETMSTPLRMPEEQALLQIVETERGLVVRLGARKYLLQEIKD